MGLFDNWWNNSAAVIGVASHGIDTGDLVTPQDVLAFFEKPWNYGELHQSWADAEYESRKPPTMRMHRPTSTGELREDER